MIIDFITKANNLSYNVKLAKLFGVYSSILLNLLLDCHFSSQEEYIKLSRDDIYNLSGIEESKQIEIEENLKSYSLLEVIPLKNSSSKNYYKLNIELITKVLTTENKDIQEELKKTFNAFKAATKPPASISKRAKIIDNLKNAISITDKQAKEYLIEWVDAVMQKSGYLSKVAVESMCEDLTKYSNNKVTLLREVCKKAAILGYKESKWVIKNYEDNKQSSNTFSLNNVNQQDVDDNINKLKNYEGEKF